MYGACNEGRNREIQSACGTGRFPELPACSSAEGVVVLTYYAQRPDYDGGFGGMDWLFLDVMEGVIRATLLV
jgi:hypothetical protein